ncbi:hypothetical protein QMP28_07090 [[Clostridium] symbiosum]|uniref:hypothetical protein n=1 Tax=Clostridium symbiosum TaxID=1512 RepID=UPI00331308C0
MAVKKNATEAAEMEGKEKTVNNTMKDGKTDSGANNEATEGEKKERETVTLAYIGPSLPAGLLKTNKILIGTREEINKELAAVLEKYPLVGKMLVPVEKLAEKKGKAATAGNILNKYYTDIVSAIAASERKEE